MSEKAEIILEGSYLYFQNDVNYSQENFKLVQMLDSMNFHIYAEILSRIENGEFLKILVRYEMNQQFLPLFVRVEKSIGNRYAQEVIKLDPQTQMMNYTFQNSQHTQEFSRSVNSKHYLSSPAISTLAIFTLSKKFDATGRTPVIFLSSQNDWSYQGPPEEKIIYAEYKNREMADFQMNNTTLAASHMCLYEFDSSHAGSEKPVDVHISKHYGIPYQVTQGSHKMVIKNLKKNS